MTYFKRDEALKAKPFHMTIVDVFHIKGRGTMIAGTVNTGTAKRGDLVEIGFPKQGSPPIRTTISTFEGFIRDIANFEAEPGDNVGVLFKELTIAQLKAGMVIVTPESIEF